MSLDNDNNSFKQMSWWKLIIVFFYSIYFHIFKFVWTYWAGYILALTSLISLIFPSRIKKSIQYFFGSLWARGLVFLGFIRFKLEVSPHVDFKKTYLYIGNHSSALDIYLYQTVIHTFVNWIAKRSLFNVPFLGSAMWTLGHIPTYRDDNLVKSMETLQTAIKRLKKGYSVCIFPEGTRSYDGVLLPFKKGGFTIARMAKVNIVPVVIKNANLVNPKGKFLLNPFVTIKIKILDPLDYTDKNIFEVTRNIMEDNLNRL